MGLIDFVISNVERDDIFNVGQTLWEYNMITFGNMWSTMYYSVKYGWRFRDKLWKEIREAIEKYYNQKMYIKNIRYY